MTIGSDFTIDFDNRAISHVAGATVYSVNALYSYIQDYFDEIAAMSHPVPMSAQTPTEYTLINSWFLTEESFKYLKGGSIQTQGLNAATFTTGVYVIKLQSVGYINFVSADIGKEVTAGATSGRLLDYNNALRKVWIRRDVGTVWSGTLTTTGGTGTGAVDTVATGENLYANVYTLGLLESSTTNLVYVQQINPELTNNEISSYWPSGHIDILVKVKESNNLIDGGILRVFVREYTDLFSHFTANVGSGGRNPIPLGTSDDTNNQTPLATVASWNDVTVSFGTFVRDVGDGSGSKTYNIEINCGTRADLREVYERLKLITARNSGFTLNGSPGQFYRSANNSYVENVPAPFGSFAGGKFFGARGVFLTNIPANDINNVVFLDSDNVSHAYPFTAAGTFLVNSTLQADPDAYYAMFFTSTPQGNYGTTDAVYVNDAFGNQIRGKVAGRSVIPWSFDYTFNNQGGRTPNTDANVTIFVTGLSSGYYSVINTTISQAIDQIISISVSPEQVYIN